MSKLKINSLVNRSDSGSPILTKGGVIPAGSYLNILGNVNASGVVTASSYNVTNVSSSGIVTASSFVGNGSGLTGITAVSATKVYAFNLIFDPVPFQA